MVVLDVHFENITFIYFHVKCYKKIFHTYTKLINMKIPKRCCWDRTSSYTNYMNWYVGAYVTGVKLMKILRVNYLMIMSSISVESSWFILNIVKVKIGSDLYSPNNILKFKML